MMFVSRAIQIGRGSEFGGILIMTSNLDMGVNASKTDIKHQMVATIEAFQQRKANFRFLDSTKSI